MQKYSNQRPGSSKRYVQQIQGWVHAPVGRRNTGTTWNCTSLEKTMSIHKIVSKSPGLARGSDCIRCHGG
eukprot:1718498-Pleurochrysis_carterae.AAC.2